MPGFTGKCLCGAVSYTSHEDPIVTINCHCEDCRRSTGAVFGTNVMVPEDRVDISGELSRYIHTADSGNTMTKMFCPSCGSLVAGTSSGRENVLSLRAGSIDDPEKIDPSVNVFLDRKLPTTLVNEGLTCWARMPGNAPWKK
jgi:hypothetical protein